MFILALVYNVVHASALFMQVVTLNVAVNSYSNALLTLLLSNQFVEIKSTVFKKIEKDNLFQLTCADIVERFQLWLMLMIIASRNIVEVGGLNMLHAAADSGAAEILKDATSSRSHSIIPNSFNILPSWSGEVLSPFFFVLGSEMVVDWIKHSYISKFNNVKPAVYSRYLDVLAKDYYTNVSCSPSLLNPTNMCRHSSTKISSSDSACQLSHYHVCSSDPRCRPTTCSSPPTYRHQYLQQQQPCPLNPPPPHQRPPQHSNISTTSSAEP